MLSAWVAPSSSGIWMCQRSSVGVTTSSYVVGMSFGLGFRFWLVVVFRFLLSAYLLYVLFWMCLWGCFLEWGVV